MRHVAADAGYQPWRLAGWEFRDTGIGDATDGLAGVRVARVTTGADEFVSHDTEFAMLVVLRGEVTFETDGDDASGCVNPAAWRSPAASPTGSSTPRPTANCST